MLRKVWMVLVGIADVISVFVIIGLFAIVLFTTFTSGFSTPNYRENIYQSCKDKGVYVFKDSRIIKCEVY